MIKKCCKCKNVKKIGEFNKNKSKKDGYNSFCRECGKNKSKEYYSQNKPRMRKLIAEGNKLRIRENQEKIFNILLSKGCIDCGNNNPIVLEFDHIDPKTKKYNVSELLGQGFSWKMIEEEVNKCEIRCANCHRIKTSIQQNWYYTILKVA